MWEYLGLGDQSMMAEGHLLEESVMGIVWMVLEFASGELAVDEGLAPFSMFELRPNDLPYLGMISIPPSPKGQGAKVASKSYSLSPRGVSSSPSLGGSPFSQAAGKRPCSSSPRQGHLHRRGTLL